MCPWLCSYNPRSGLMSIALHKTVLCMFYLRRQNISPIATTQTHTWIKKHTNKQTNHCMLLFSMPKLIGTDAQIRPSGQPDTHWAGLKLSWKHIRRSKDTKLYLIQWQAMTDIHNRLYTECFVYCHCFYANVWNSVFIKWITVFSILSHIFQKL